MAKIGVFWVHDGMVFGKSVEVTVGVEGVPGLVDSPDSHADVWEFERPWAQVSKSLGVVEYQDVPRGRVLSNRGKPLVYLDKVLMGSDSKLIISRFFEFDPEVAVWRGDSHYTTASAHIDRLFADDLD